MDKNYLPVTMKDALKLKPSIIILAFLALLSSPISSNEFVAYSYNSNVEEIMDSTNES